MTNGSYFLHKDLNYEINGCAFETFKEVGVGFNEAIYHKYFHQRLIDRGLNAKYKVALFARYRNETIADFVADEVIEDCLVVEIKCIQTEFIPENYAQVFTYLKLMNLKLGLLINFGLHKAFSKRVIFDDTRAQNTESWDEGFHSNLHVHDALDGVLASIRAVDETFGPGFHSRLYLAALRVEFCQNRISHIENVRVPVESEIIHVDPMATDFWLVEDSFMLAVLAGKDKPRKYDIFRMRSYLSRMRLKHGVIAYWSTNNLQLCGIYQPHENLGQSLLVTKLD